jgi:hypothetical protein
MNKVKIRKQQGKEFGPALAALGYAKKAGQLKKRKRSSDIGRLRIMLRAFFSR